MCKAISMVLTKTGVYFGKTDKHEEIIEFHDIRQDKIRCGIATPDIIRVEIFPENGDYSLPISTWKYMVDQTEFPSWYSASFDENTGYAEDREL